MSHNDSHLFICNIYLLYVIAYLLSKCLYKCKYAHTLPWKHVMCHIVYLCIYVKRLNINELKCELIEIDYEKNDIIDLIWFLN